MTEILVGSLILILIVLGLTLGLLAAKRRLVPGGAIDVTVNGTTHLEAERGAKLLGVLHGGGIGIAFNYNSELGAFVDSLLDEGRLAGKIHKVDPKGRLPDLRHLIPILCPFPVEGSPGPQ